MNRKCRKMRTRRNFSYMAGPYTLLGRTSFELRKRATGEQHFCGGEYKDGFSKVVERISLLATVRNDV